MTQTPEQLEQKRVEEIAVNYKQRGYEVVVKPTSDKLPDFLKAFQPDLIVLNGKDKAVVEVKTDASLVADDQIEDLARVMEDHRDWRFELVITNPPKEAVLEVENNSLSPREIAEGIDEVKFLINAGYQAAALLQAWSLLEAALRFVAARKYGSVEDKIEDKSVIYLAKKLVSLGTLSQADYDTIYRARENRNAVAHGYRADEDEGILANQLLDIALRLHPIVEFEIKPEELY